jgi:hypothetical protein
MTTKEILIPHMTPELFERQMNELGMNVSEFARMHRRTIQRQYAPGSGKQSAIGSVLWALAFAALKDGYRVDIKARCEAA